MKTRPIVAVTRPMPFPALDRLRGHCDVRQRDRDGLLGAGELANFAADSDAILTTLADLVDARTLEALTPGLRVVSNYAVGTDNIDLATAAKLGVVVTNTPGVLTNATADLAMSIILALRRRLIEGDRMVRRGEFQGWEPTLLLGHDLEGKVLGIFGFGRIGRAVARRALSFGMSVIYCSRSAVPNGEQGGMFAKRVSFDELVTASDVISLHAPLNSETRGVFGAGVLAKMKPGAVIVNTARGPLVDEKALARLLCDGHLGGAGFDVYTGEPNVDAELLRAPNTILLPHLGSATRETRSRMAELCVDGILEVLGGRRPSNSVGAPGS